MATNTCVLFSKEGDPTQNQQQRKTGGHLVAEAQLNLALYSVASSTSAVLCQKYPGGEGVRGGCMYCATEGGAMTHWMPHTAGLTRSHTIANCLIFSLCPKGQKQRLLLGKYFLMVRLSSQRAPTVHYTPYMSLRNTAAKSRLFTNSLPLYYFALQKGQF